MHAADQTSKTPAGSCCEQGRLSGQARPVHHCEARQRTVEVVDVRVEAPGLGEAGMEAELPVLGEALAPKLQTSGHYLDMALAQGIIHYILILLHLQAWSPHLQTTKGHGLGLHDQQLICTSAKLYLAGHCTLIFWMCHSKSILISESKFNVQNTLQSLLICIFKPARLEKGSARDIAKSCRYCQLSWPTMMEHVE